MSGAGRDLAQLADRLRDGACQELAAARIVFGTLREHYPSEPLPQEMSETLAAHLEAAAEELDALISSLRRV